MEILPGPPEAEFGTKSTRGSGLVGIMVVVWLGSLGAFSWLLSQSPSKSLGQMIHVLPGCLVQHWMLVDAACIQYFSILRVQRGGNSPSNTSQPWPCITILTHSRPTRFAENEYKDKDQGHSTVTVIVRFSSGFGLQPYPQKVVRPPKTGMFERFWDDPAFPALLVPIASFDPSRVP